MEKHIAYTQEQINFIKRVLVKNQGTIEVLVKTQEVFMPNVICEAGNEITTCLRILEKEYQYVSGI